MFRHLFFLLLLMCNFSFLTSQEKFITNISPDSLHNLKVGIYLNSEQLLKNDPGIPYRFEILDYKPDYWISPGANHDFYLSYYNMIGIKTAVPLSDVWGFYDGEKLFISYDEKPYEVISFGSISLLLFNEHYRRNFVSQAISLYALGFTVTDVDYNDLALLDLQSGIVLPAKNKYLEDMIADDYELFDSYENCRESPRSLKWLLYFQKYNERNPLKLSKDGFKLK